MLVACDIATGPVHGLALPPAGHEGGMRIIVAAWRRLRRADGTSHVRALAYQSAFVMMSGFVGIVGLAGVLDLWPLRATVRELATRVIPGEGGTLLAEALRRSANGGATAAVVGLGAALGSGVLAMAQLHRSAHRLHGVVDDGGPVRTYGRALLLAPTAGLLLVLGGLVIGGGRSIARGLGLDGTAAVLWGILRWPLGLALAGTAIAVVARVSSPGRPPTRDVLAGSATALVLWAVFTALLGLYLSIGSKSVYGPLLTVIAMLLWAAASSLALHLGLALVAERRAREGPPDPSEDGRRSVGSPAVVRPA